MSNAVIVDTNVAMVANDQTPQAGPDCVDACEAKLEEIVRGGSLLLDTSNHILDEYENTVGFSGSQLLGYAFFQWVWDNQAVPERCPKVAITPNDSRVFEEFPEDPKLGAFDSKDRKFVAVAIASGQQPPIIIASDRGWWKYHQELQEHGVRVEFLCPELMEE